MLDPLSMQNPSEFFEFTTVIQLLKCAVVRGYLNDIRREHVNWLPKVDFTLAPRDMKYLPAH